MRNLLFAAAVMLPAIALTGCDDVASRRQRGEKVFHNLSYEEALARAKAEHKAVMVDFSMPN